MALQLRHDEFARETMMRECVSDSNRKHDCQWCGNRPARLFEYYFVRDDSMRTPLRRNKKLFCNLDCLNSCP